RLKPDRAVDPRHPGCGKGKFRRTARRAEDSPRQSLVELQHAAERPGNPLVLAAVDQPTPTREAGQSCRTPPRESPAREPAQSALQVAVRLLEVSSRIFRTNLILWRRRDACTTIDQGISTRVLIRGQRLLVQRWFHEWPPHLPGPRHR